ncbi:chromosome segregation protein SMC [Hyphobacterium sp. HN65]|uniref:Chromosome partition protein Smc n=1 Tax=Hyphobacterium lacteum TaxID=3116575 RepID=A0ABU7LMX6_9PROT|nr:chromosome segregation protein SMC [Hyphobacterium sp. HN65]MEE2525281.1 chromosome segregation protein SMC [Hyphobacterium sp. HN65]
MEFNSLRLTGFKSFVDSTELSIEPGLTGVIGPNGCGKSNLLEALRWVMGATSAKSLRGSGMEDVIFSGTDARPSREHAEVKLVIANDDRTAPARFNENTIIEVVRRIVRGAGSTYKVNGEEVRAKDVQLLFADAGTGANSPALVRQGQISELINAKPENRRRVLEEAAGVSGLRARRHESELRLKAAESNLDRLQDVIDELESRQNDLQRQSRQAARYRKLSADIRSLEAALWLRRYRDAETAVETAVEALRASDSVATEAAEKAAAASVQAEQAAAGLEPARQAEAEASAALRRIERERDTLDRDAADAERHVESLEQRLRDLAAQIEREGLIGEDAEAAIERIRVAIAALEAEAEGETAALEAAATRRDEVAAELDARRTEFDAAAAAFAEIRAEREAATRNRTQAEQRVSRLSLERDRANQSFALLGSGDEGELNGIITAAEQAEKDAETARQAREAAEADRLLKEAGERAAAEPLSALKAEASALEREIATLTRMLEQDEVEDRALDKLRAKAGYEKALGAALGDDVEASLNPDAARHWSANSVRAEALPAGCEPLGKFVEAPSVLTARLESIGVVEAEHAHEIAAQLKPGQRLVTREGDLWRWDGLVSGADAPTAAAARLEQRNRLEAAEAENADLLKRVAAANDALDEASMALTQAREHERDIRRKASEAEQAARSAQSAAASAREKVARDNERRSALSAEIDRLTSELEEARAALKQAEDALKDDARLASAETARDEAKSVADAAREVSDEARQAYDDIARAAAMRTRRIAELTAEREDWQKRSGEARERLDALAGTRTEIETQLEAARSRPGEIRARLANIAETLTEASRLADEARDKALAVEAAAKGSDAEARAAEREASTARERRAADEARLAGARERLDETDSRLREATGETAKVLAERVDEKFEELDLDSLDQKLDSARQSRERLGAVNLRADQEAEELQAKREELTTERDDLLAAIDRLRKGIDALSREGRARLLEAFEQIDANFRQLFETLFEGGSAELALTESDDPLEAGLEIFACPPGKKMERMSLMSGGEQALTASALIFAVFLSNPAPVCVLDEVDAPLDDANVDRFCRMLDEMRRLTATRFLVITHNPLTMSRMDRLYGVTMAERGVSQLVSVDLARAEQLIAAE